MVSGHFVQLQIISLLHLIELLGLLIGLGLLDRVRHPGVHHSRKSYEVSGGVSGFISSFLRNRRLWVVLVGKSS